MIYVLAATQQLGRDWCRSNGVNVNPRAVRILSHVDQVRGLLIGPDDEVRMAAWPRDVDWPHGPALAEAVEVARRC